MDKNGHLYIGSLISTGSLTGTQLISNIATGTAPFSVASTTMVTNLNTEYLNGQLGSYYTNAGNLSGTIPSAVLGNSSLFVGTTSVALNRASASLALTGVTNTNWDSAYNDTNNATNLNTASTIVKRDVNGNFNAGTITATTFIGALTGTASGNLTSDSTLNAGNLSGTIPSAVLGNSTVYIGTTAIALNRGTTSQSLTGVSVDGNAGSASAVSTSAENTGTTPRYILFADAVSGNQALKTDTGLTYHPTNNALTATTFIGVLDGNAGSATLIATTQKSDSVAYQVPFVTSVTAGNQALYTDSVASFTYNPSTNTLVVPNITATLTGSASGNAGSATLIATTQKSDNVNYQIPFVTSVTAGNQALHTDSISSLIFNPSTNTLSVQNLTVSETLSINNVEMISTSNGIVFEGTTNNDFETTLYALDPTEDRTLALPNASGTVALTSDIGNGTMTITAGTGLSNGGSFTANQSGNTSVTINHSNSITAGNVGPGANSSPAYGGTFTVPQLYYDAQGHLVTNTTNRTITLPATPVTSFSGGTTGLLPSSGTTDAVTLSGTLIVGNGGTGATSFTSGDVLIGNNTGAITTLSRSGIDSRSTFPASQHSIASHSATA